MITPRHFEVVAWLSSFMLGAAGTGNASVILHRREQRSPQLNRGGISPERGTPSRSAARGPLPEGEMPWRDAPQSAMTLELGWVLLAAILLVCLGLLLGATWTMQALQPQLNRQAEERRRLNEEWAAVRATRHQLSECPRCGCVLTRRDWYVTPTPAESPPDDD